MRPIARSIWLPTAIFAAMLCARSAKSDEAPLFEQEPFDTIKLDDENKNVVLKVQPLDLPNRLVPAKPKPEEELEIRLLDRPRKAYKLSWEHVTEVKLFERMVLDEAELLTTNGKFDEAYPYYEFLQRRYPKMTELAASYEKFLFASAGAAYKQQRYEESLGVLWELFDRDPEHKGVTAAIQRVVGVLFERWIAEENYVAAIGILHEASARLKDRAEPMVGDGNQRLQKLAADRLAKAKNDFQAGRYSEARKACRQALTAWPEIEGGAALTATMHAKYPFVEVGLTAGGGSDWAIHRTTRLLTRSLAELSRFDGESGIYDTPLLKSCELANQRLSLTIKPGIHWPGGSTLTAADLARTLLAEADPRNPLYRPQWAKLVAGVTLPAVDRVEVELQQPIQRAEPWLNVPMWRTYGLLAGHGGLGPYKIASSSPQEVRYLTVDDYFAAGKNPPKEILERLYPNTEAALQALRHDDVQIVDRVGPFEAESLKDSPSLVVEPYAAPTVHVLVFNRRRAMMNNATFRRAMAHALNRQSILNDNLSHGVATAGGRVTDTLLTQRPRNAASRGAASTGQLRYDRSTAEVLMQVALGQGPTQPAAGSAIRAPFLRTKALILEHPADDVARMACLAIQHQFQAIGLTLTLRERSSVAAASNAESSDADLYYVEWRPLEPASSLDRLLGADGLGGGSDVAEMLSQLTEATSADRRSIKLADADDLILEQTLLIPLWQLTDYVAYRRDLNGIGQQPITLYQNVEQWRFGGDGG
jgi:ABC-type transport system substrate-binding protein